MPHPSFTAFAHQRHGGALVTAGLIFAFGVVVGAIVRPALSPQSATAFDTARAAVSDAAPATSVGTSSHKFDVQTVYPAEVVRVIDGDTFQARVQVWPGLSVDTKVRLRGIDAPELHARCADETQGASRARRAGNDPGGGRGDDFACRDRQIWRARRCIRRHPRHGRCFGSTPEWRLGAQLRWRKARLVVLIPGNSHQ